MYTLLKYKLLEYFMAQCFGGALEISFELCSSHPLSLQVNLALNCQGSSPHGSHPLSGSSPSVTGIPQRDDLVLVRVAKNRVAGAGECPRMGSTKENVAQTC